jgi:hypothetical protein
MGSLAEIENLTKCYADARGLLSERVTSLQVELESAKRRKLPGIRSAVAAAAEARARLQSAIEAAPGLFVKPRSVIVHGIKVGLQKAKGKLWWADTNRVVELIKKHFPGRVDELVKVTESPRKSALQDLSVADLKRIGCMVEEAGDQVLIKPVDSDVDKLVAALLGEAEAEEGEE